MLKVGIIGLGRIGRLHFKHLFERSIVDKSVAVAKLCSISEDEKNMIKNLYGYTDDMFVNNYQELLDSDVNTVINAAITNVHYEINKKFIQQGKHLFAEKPSATEVSQLDEMIKLNEKSKVKIGVNYNRRFSKNFLKMKESIISNQVGNVECIRISSRDPSPAPKEYLLASGGIHKDCTIHDFDMSNYLMGQTPEKVFAQGSALFLNYLKDVNDCDTAVTVLTYKSGQMCIIENSRRTGFNYDQRVEVFGEKGALVNSNKAPNEVEQWTKEGRKRDLGYEFFLDYYQDAIRDSLNSFFDYAQGKRESHVSLVDARNALKIATAASESAKTGKQVEIDE